MNKLDPKAFGLAFGILWGGGVLFMGATAFVCTWAQPFVDFLSVMYVGYSASLLGILIGTVWGFVDGFIGGLIFVWLYNKFVK